MIKEVRIGPLEYGDLLNYLVSQDIGKEPMAISLDEELKKKYPILDIISTLELSFDHLDIDPRFPFPIYLIDEGHFINRFRIKILKKIEDIPKYFQNFNPKSREKDFLWDRKKVIVSSKIKKEQVRGAFDKMIKMKKLQRELSHNLKIYTFYGKILKYIEEDLVKKEKIEYD